MLSSSLRMLLLELFCNMYPIILLTTPRSEPVMLMPLPFTGTCLVANYLGLLASILAYARSNHASFYCRFVQQLPIVYSVEIAIKT